MKNINLTDGQKKGIYIGLGIVAVYFIYKLLKKPKKDELEPEVATQTEAIKQPNQTNFVPKKADYNQKLSKGDAGLEVGILQKSLKGLDVDGKFGDGTEGRLFDVTGKKTITLNEFNDFLTKKKVTVDSIVKSGNASDVNFLKTLETAYLEAWNKGIEESKAFFEYKGNLYNTKGGKAAYRAV